MSTAVPADESYYVTHRYQYTPEGFPEQDKRVLPKIFIITGKVSKILFHNLR